MNQLAGFSQVAPQIYAQRPTASAGGNSTLDSVGSSEPGSLPRRPQFDAASNEGQNQSVRWGRSLTFALALMMAGAVLGGCATVHRPNPEPPVAGAARQEPPAKQVGREMRQFGQEWHENVNKPVAEKAVGIGHWFRDRAKEFRDGITGK